MLWGHFTNSIFKVDLVGKNIFLKTPQNNIIEIVIWLEKGNIQNRKGFKILISLMNWTKKHIDENFLDSHIWKIFGVLYLKTYYYTAEMGI